MAESASAQERTGIDVREVVDDVLQQDRKSNGRQSFLRIQNYAGEIREYKSKDLDASFDSDAESLSDLSYRLRAKTKAWKPSMESISFWH